MTNFVAAGQPVGTRIHHQGRTVVLKHSALTIGPPWQSSDGLFYHDIEVDWLVREGAKVHPPTETC